MPTKQVMLACVGVAVGLVGAACAPPPLESPAAPPPEPPVAIISATPLAGDAPLEVAFSAERSFHQNTRGGSIDARTWDFGDGSPAVEGWYVAHTYRTPGDYTVTLTVTDDRGLSGTATVLIVVASPPLLRPPAPLSWPEPIDVHVVGAPIAEAGSGEWDTGWLREPGAPLYDPVTGSWICVYTGVLGWPHPAWATVGAVVSVDGETWAPHPQNPITPLLAFPGSGSPLNSEDPYIAKSADGEVWRDSAGRALMFSEEKDGHLHLGLNLWRSAPNTLDDWTLYGQVVPPGLAGTWDETDRTSPVVIHDGEQLVMLYEGRNLVEGQQGMVGLATSTDEGVTWDVEAEPIVASGDPGAWNAQAVVPDDLVRIDDEWVLLVHGFDGTSWLNIGRYITADEPADWDARSFEQLPGNPVTTRSNTLMAWGDEPDHAMWISADGRRLERLAVRRR